MTRPMSEERETLDEARDAVLRWDAVHKARGYIEPRTIRFARALLSTSASERGMREALEYVVPLAEIALEACRDQRCRAGHHDIVFTKRDGVQWVGLYQDEYDRLENAKDALAALSPKGEG